MARIQGDLPDRSFEFAVAIVKLIDLLPSGTKGWVIGRQLLRAATSIGANVREADESLTDAEFAYRCSIARREASETQYWLALCEHTQLLATDEVAAPSEEAAELARILSTIVKKTRARLRRSSP